ncbi:MAG: translation initiation factor IF-3 [Candidatus Ornithospirochaeta sp.]|nr:translation initiation factor IF-3 [Sphaerochaetaceae bacterium]MDD7162890.1 translation initiation factor IF-3 [Sphaerochaetaceae bacterium]MDY5523532.1 translation initiation factor IF-3 [Candidatus Ornithospirochaeta sp.]
MATKDLRINRQIRAREVFLIDENGEQKGVINTYDAYRMAEEAGLDLVEVSPMANPPVCKILDFGKYRYEMEKKQKEAKKNQAVTKLKEVRMQSKIADNDVNTKSKAISEFLSEGNKVKVSIRFKGRTMTHPELGKEVLDTILVKLSEMGCAFNLDKSAFMEGKMMSMMLSPAKSAKAKPKAQQEAPKAPEKQ